VSVRVRVCMRVCVCMREGVCVCVRRVLHVCVGIEFHADRVRVCVRA
jgi:hypothetical protein